MMIMSEYEQVYVAGVCLSSMFESLIPAQQVRPEVTLQTLKQTLYTLSVSERLCVRLY